MQKCKIMNNSTFFGKYSSRLHSITSYSFAFHRCHLMPVTNFNLAEMFMKLEDSIESKLNGVFTFL